MTDPAAEAAQRAWEAADEPFIPNMSLEQAAIAAAREALTPIREALAEAIQVAQSGTTGTPPNVDGVTESEALAIMGDALIKIAPLIYPSEDS